MYGQRHLKEKIPYVVNDASSLMFAFKLFYETYISYDILSNQ